MNMRREQLAQGQSTLDITNRLSGAIEDYVYGDMKAQLKKIESIDKQLEKIDDLIAKYEEVGKKIGKSTEEIEAEQALTDKYGQITEKGLGENSKYWNDFEKMVNESVAKQDEYLKAQQAYEDAQKQYEANKKAAQSVAAAQGAVNGNSTGTAITSSYTGRGPNSESVLEDDNPIRVIKPGVSAPDNAYTDTGTGEYRAIGDYAATIADPFISTPQTTIQPGRTGAPNSYIDNSITINGAKITDSDLKTTLRTGLQKSVIQGRG